MIHVAFPSPAGFEPACGPVPSDAPDDAAWVVLRGHDVLVRVADGRPELLDTTTAQRVGARARHHLGQLDGAPCLLAVIPPDAPLPEDVRAEGLRGVLAALLPASQSMAAYAAQIAHWDRTTRFCGECGRATEPSPAPERRCKRCPGCHHEWYPRVSPCTITLVYDGDRVLLTRKAEWPAGRYGLVAGFVDPGESLEDCVRREAWEEAGVRLVDVHYAGSQPWPFPHQLMVGFTARWAGGEAHPRDGELEDVRWFHRDGLPTLPPRLSIARRLLDAWLARG